MPKTRRGVSTTQLAEELSCSVDMVYKLMKDGVFKPGRKGHYWTINPNAARPTYRWQLDRCLATLEELEKASLKSAVDVGDRSDLAEHHRPAGEFPQ